MSVSGDPYWPRGSTEVCAFESSFCVFCIHDHQAHMGHYDQGCPLWGRALCFSVDDDRYPTELVYDDEGRGVCTKYEPDGC